jgi:hypothetical protein
MRCGLLHQKPVRGFAMSESLIENMVRAGSYCNISYHEYREQWPQMVAEALVYHRETEYRFERQLFGLVTALAAFIEGPRNSASHSILAMALARLIEGTSVEWQHKIEDLVTTGSRGKELEAAIRPLVEWWARFRGDLDPVFDSQMESVGRILGLFRQREKLEIPMLVYSVALPDGTSKHFRFLTHAMEFVDQYGGTISRLEVS